MPRSKRDQPSTSAAAAAKDKAKRSKRRSNRIESDSSSSSADDDYAPEQSAFRATQFNSSATIGADPVTLANNMVKYFLNFSASKYPIKRADVCKAINVAPKMFPDVMKDCETKLKDIYGLEVADVSETKNSSVFIVLSDKNYAVSAANYPPEQRSEITLLFIILSYIFMKNGEVQDSEWFPISCRVHALDHCFFQLT